MVLDPPEAGLRIGVAESEPVEPIRRPFTARVVTVFLFFGGLWAVANPIVLAVVSKGLCCICFPMFLETIWGVAAVVRAVQILFSRGRPKAPVVLVLIQMYLGGALDLPNTVLGVLNLLMLCAPRSRAYFRNEWGE
jgi:hypothetical protein